MCDHNFIIFPYVEMGENGIIGAFVIIGEKPKGHLNNLKTKIGNNALIRSHTVIYFGNAIGDSFQTGHGVLIRENNQIGDNVSIGSHCVIEHQVVIGNRVRIHSNTFIPEHSVLEDQCWIGPNVVFTNALYPLSPDAKKNLIGPHIKPGAKVGANATLLPGVRIGRNALVGAGSVVVHDVPDWKVVVGNPARIIKDVRELDQYQIESTIDRGNDEL
jgi:acetyltransferase-like isoleucine patch superfamily enzyme